jgi:hypothetical protein
MTISSTNTFEFNLGQMVRMAHIDAGLINVNQSCTAPQVQDGLDKLQEIVSSSQARGIFARVVSLYNLTLTAASLYTLPTYAIDVFGSAMYIDPTQPVSAASGELPVMPMSRNEWQEESNKSSTGVPSRYWANRAGAAVQVQIWPVPSTTQVGGTIRFQIHKYRADVQDANATADFEHFWVSALVTSLTRKLCFASSQLDKYMALAADERDRWRECRAMSTQRVNQQAVFAHRSGWRGR